MPPGTPGEAQPPAQPVRLESEPGSAGAIRPTAVTWPEAIRAAAIAGVVVAIGWAVPFVGLFLWMAAAGVLAVVLYHTRYSAAPLDARQGAKIGAVAGLVAFGAFALLMSLQLLVSRGGSRLRGILEEAMRQAAARNPNPQAQEILQKMTSPEGLAVLLTLVMILFFVIFVAMSSLGGMLGAKLLRGRNRGEP